MGCDFKPSQNDIARLKKEVEARKRQQEEDRKAMEGGGIIRRVRPENPLFRKGVR